MSLDGEAELIFRLVDGSIRGSVLWSGYNDTRCETEGGCAVKISGGGRKERKNGEGGREGEMWTTPVAVEKH